jgi:hypothetical protein
VKSGRTWKGTQRLRTKDNRCITVETTILPRFDDTGKFENSISIRTDVSRAKAEGAEEGRNAIIEALPDEVFIYDAETFRLSYANENARRRMRCELGDVPRLCLSISSTPMKCGASGATSRRCCRANARGRIWRSTT